MPRSWPPQPARNKKRSSKKGCDTSRLLSRKQVHIAAAAYGLDSLLVAIIRPKLAPQIAHMHVNAAVHGGHRAAQRGLRQVFTSNDLSWTAQESVEQIEFGAGKAHWLARAGHAA